MTEPVAERDQLRRLSTLFETVRLLAVPLAFTQVATTELPPGFESWAWGACAALAVGAVLLFALSRRTLSTVHRTRVAELALAFDAAVVFAFIFLYAYQDGQPLYALFYLPVLEAALRFGVAGGAVMALATAPLLLAAEFWRAERFDPHDVRPDVVFVRIALGVILGVLVGKLVDALDAEGARAAERAAEAERLRDELAHRVDALDAANRCARALASSLDVDEAFAAFLRELAGLIPFDRVAIVLAEGTDARVMASAGTGSETVFPPRSTRPIRHSVLERVLAGETIYREDLGDIQWPEERELLEVGIRSRLAVPLAVGARAIGMLSIQRTRPHAFSAEEIELATLLGRLVGTAVQNIRSYEAEHATAEELRRLSALRADFVSLVSHELRSPMAAVIGSARTLQSRWRELTPAQRESFLTLIGDETDRLAALIADVLDTSRIEAGTFSFTFSDVDVVELVRETVATASMGQDEVRVEASVHAPLPTVRGDRDRLRQVLINLIDNAVKYSPTGDEVRVAATQRDGTVEIAVTDHGPGIPSEHQQAIFEKFGRAGHDRTKPGTGLGLFIARSIAEAHGGRLELRSAPHQGSTFTLTLPTGADAPANGATSSTP